MLEGLVQISGYMYVFVVVGYLKDNITTKNFNNSVLFTVLLFSDESNYGHEWESYTAKSKIDPKRCDADTLSSCQLCTPFQLCNPVFK